MRPQRVMAEDRSFRVAEDPEELLLTPLKVQGEGLRDGFREEDQDQSTVKPSGELKPLRTTLYEEGERTEEGEMQLLPFRNISNNLHLFH